MKGKINGSASEIIQKNTVSSTFSILYNIFAIDSNMIVIGFIDFSMYFPLLRTFVT